MEDYLKIIAGFFAFLFIATTVLAFALYSVEWSAFDANLYIQALDEENVYQRLPELAAKTLSIAAQNPNRNFLLGLFSNLSEDEWRTLIVNLLPPDVLRTLANDAVTQVLNYLNGKGDVAILSLSGLKAHLQSPEGVNAVYAMLKTQPDCTLEELTAMALNQQALTLCNPPDTFLVFDLRPVIESEIRATMSLLPDQVTIVSADANRLQNLRDLRALRLFMRLSPLLPLFFLLLITVLVVRSLRSWLTWWGYPLLAAGLASMFVSAFSGPVAALTFQFFIRPVLPDIIPAAILDVFRDLTATIIRHALQPTLLLAGILAFVGLIMVVWTFLLQKGLPKNAMYR